MARQASIGIPALAARPVDRVGGVDVAQLRVMAQPSHTADNPKRVNGCKTGVSSFTGEDASETLRNVECPGEAAVRAGCVVIAMRFSSQE